MSGLVLIVIGVGLFLLAFVIPILTMNMMVKLNRSFRGAERVDQSIFIVVGLGLPGILLEILGCINLTQLRSGWIFIVLGVFFSICTLVIPISWLKLTNRLNPSAELDGIARCFYIVVIAFTLIVLSLTHLIIGIVLLFPR